MMDDFFEWNPEKAEANLKKHGVSFEEAASVFYDPLSLTIPDIIHSDEENRFIIIGLSDNQQQLVVAHTDRGDKIRIISARLATPREKRIYERENE
ncbi:MAG TPA: BrnT family toxin [Pyrinomonadaceae bacterium]|nr:BrnT family toxin [Pyrinomonadaceae bacterium]